MTSSPFFGPGVGFGMNLHLPPMNLRPPVQKQWGGLPRRPPEHLAFEGCVVLGVCVWGCSRPEVVLLPAPEEFGVGFANRRHAPPANMVPDGQQFGGAPTGRDAGHGSVFPELTPLAPPVPPSLPAGADFREKSCRHMWPR
jgi:hypothetical protein